MNRKEAALKLSMHLMQCSMLMPIEWIERNGEGSEFLEAMRIALDALNEATAWTSVKDGLPKNDEQWVEYNVIVCRTHFPTSSFDLCDEPYDEEFVTSALFDSAQKIWHLQRFDECLNALISVDELPLNGDYVTHWMPLPEPPKEDDAE